MASRPTPPPPTRSRPADDAWDDGEDEVRPRKKKARLKSEGSPKVMIIVGLLVLGVIIVFGVVVVIALMNNIDKKDQQAGNNAADTSSAPPHSNFPGRNQGRGNNTARDGMAQMPEGMLQQFLQQMTAFQSDPGQEDKLGEETAAGDRFALRVPKGFNSAPSQTNGAATSYIWTSGPQAEIPGGHVEVTVAPPPGQPGYPPVVLRSLSDNFWNGLNKLPAFSEMKRAEPEDGRIGSRFAEKFRFTGKLSAMQNKIKGTAFVTYDTEKIVILVAIVPEEAGDSVLATLESSLLTIRKK
jgi:hypothetical protein